jgi:YVTN family beta-propeller protein
MKLLQFVLPFTCLSLLTAPLQAQHAQVSSVAVQPGNPNRVWVCNRDNGTVAVIDIPTATKVAEVTVGEHPRSLAFNATGTRVLVANQRGDIPVGVNFVTPFTGAELRGSVSVINTATFAVTTTLTNMGVEPYGIALAPNGKFFVVSGMRSGTMKFLDAVSFAQVLDHQFLRNLNNIPVPFTMADADANRDGIADEGDPRGFVIRSDSQRIYVTHNKSSYISVLQLTLNGSGIPTAVVSLPKIQTDEYPFDPIFNPTPVQVLQSQGKPRFLEDIALSPDGTRALIPHVLHNVNHDVNHNFGPGMAGDFANRVYPALTMVDATLNSYGQLGDASNRLHNELSDPLNPAAFIPFGRGKKTTAGNIIILGGSGSPTPGSSADFVVDGLAPGDTGVVLIGRTKINQPFGTAGNLLVTPRFQVPLVGNTATMRIGNSPTLNGVVFIAQALITHPTNEQTLSTGLRFVINPVGYGQNKMGHRAGHPGRVIFNPAGDRAIMLNRGSEDVFVYKVNGSDMELLSVFPPRYGFAPRTALDTSTPMGDLPLGMAITPDTSTPNNDDAKLFIINEATRTLSVLRVDWLTGTVHSLSNTQISTHTGPDKLTASQRLGEEIFEDASRPQTSGNFNNSCGSCHFEGGEDGNVWQRGNGPRSTMPMYGGSLGTGLILWKGVRLNNGETGPMFGGENGGTGIFSNAEQQALVDFHGVLAFPLNPNLHPVTGAYNPAAALGKDLFFGKNDTGLNPTLRHAGCATCHPDVEINSNPGPRFYTIDFIDPVLTGGENLATQDPGCFALRENVVAINIRNVNTGANVDMDADTIPDPDRNLDGYNDLETYAIMNADKDDPFQRDDANSYQCPCDPNSESNCDPLTFKRIFGRPGDKFSVPHKLGVFASGPYFHDHVVFTLRGLVDPDVQALSPVYGSPAFPLQPPYPGINKIFNDVHDVRGHQAIVSNASKVQLTLQSGINVEQDIASILEYIQSL